MDTAMKASKNMSTAPAMGKTMGIMGTISSTTSWGASLALSLGVAWGADMSFLSKNKRRPGLALNRMDFTHKPGKRPVQAHKYGH
jgi:hypothetical protein